MSSPPSSDQGPKFDFRENFVGEKYRNFDENFNIDKCLREMTEIWEKT